MTKFNIGDKVQCGGLGSGSEKRLGGKFASKRIGTILNLNLSEEGNSYYVRFNIHLADCYWILESELSLYSLRDTENIIVTEENAKESYMRGYINGLKVAKILIETTVDPLRSVSLLIDGYLKKET